MRRYAVVVLAFVALAVLGPCGPRAYADIQPPPRAPSGLPLTTHRMMEAVVIRNLREGRDGRAPARQDAVARRRARAAKEGAFASAFVMVMGLLCVAMLVGIAWTYCTGSRASDKYHSYEV